MSVPENMSESELSPEEEQEEGLMSKHYLMNAERKKKGLKPLPYVYTNKELDPEQ